MGGFLLRFCNVSHWFLVTSPISLIRHFRRAMNGSVTSSTFSFEESTTYGIPCWHLCATFKLVSGWRHSSTKLTWEELLSRATSRWIFVRCGGNRPCTSYSRTIYNTKMATDGYDIAYTFPHNNITLEHNAMNNKNTIAHMDEHNTQY